MFNNKRRIFSIILTIVLVVGLLLGAVGQIVFADSNTKNITIVHLNDIHGRVKEDEREGAMGFALLKAKVDALKSENPNLLLLNAGDTFHGTTLVNITEGETMVGLMNTLGFDAMTPGNHDFNYGYKRLLELKEMAKFPILSANVQDEKSKKNIFDNYIIKDVDGVKVGIFGITTEETKFKSHPKNTEGVEFINPVEVAKDMVGKLKDEKADIVIALGHMGVEGTTLTTAEEIINKVDGIDLFIDGHSHEETNKKIKDTLLVQAGEYTKNMGVVQLEITKGKISKSLASLFPYEQGKKLTPDPVVLDEIKKIDDINKPILDVVLGETKVKLDGERGNVRTKETNFGNLIADTMLESAQGDIAFTNGGGIRASIDTGSIKVNDVITSVPFTNTLAVIEATGAEIVQALERGVDSYPEEAGHFPQIAGIKFGFDPTKEKGKRVDLKTVTIKDKAIDLGQKYKVVTNDFIAAGGDGYTMFGGKPFVGEGGLLSDLLKEKIQETKVIEPKVENRISIVQIDNVSTINTKQVSVSINGAPIEFTEETGSPIIKDGRTLVPVRVISENLGHNVGWDSKMRIVSIDKNISLKINEEFVTVSGEKIKMDSKAQIINNKTYVPLKFVSEALGYKVQWDGTTRTADVLKPIEIKPAA